MQYNASPAPYGVYGQQLPPNQPPVQPSAQHAQGNKPTWMPTEPPPPSMQQSQPYAFQGQQAQAQYAPPPGPPQGQYNGNGNGYNPNANGYQEPSYGTEGGKQGNPPQPGERFAPKKRLRDPIFLILFLASTLGFAALSGIVLNNYNKYGGLGGGVGNGTQGGTGTAVTLDSHTVYMFLFVAGLGFLLSVLYLMLIRAFTKVIMEITLFLSVVLNIGICVYYFVIKYWSGAIIFLIIAIISVLSYWFMRKRIPFAKLCLQITMDIAKHHPSVYFVVILGLIVQTALSAWYSFTVIGVYVSYTPGSAACATNSCSSGKVAGLVFFATFAFLWVSQVVANVCLATLAGGAFGGWYYYGPAVKGGQGGMPSRPNLKAFGRATTWSLGSIAFGSLIVTILEILRQLFRLLSQYESGQGDAIGAILACVASCCIGCIESAVQYFNKYAYIEIALYGKAYIPSAKRTWALFKDRGIDALVNDSIVNTALSFGAFAIGLLCSGFAYWYVRYTNPAYNTDGQYSAVIILFAFLIGLNCGLTLTSALDAGVSTLFVGMAEDPELLRDRNPELFGMVAQTYPKVLQPVMEA